MKSILYSALVGSLALALTAGGAQAATEKEKRAQRAKPQQRSAMVQAARPATAARPASTMPATARAQRNVSAAQYRQQRSHAQPRTSSNVNPAAAGQASTTPATVRAAPPATAARRASTMSDTTHARRDVAVNQAKRPASTTAAKVNRDRNVAVNRRPASAPPATARNRNVAANRERNVTVDQNRNFDANVNRKRNVAVKTQPARPASTTPATVNVKRFRNTNEFRNRRPTSATSATVVNRNVTVNRTQDGAFYRGGNVRITNNWRGDAFRGQRYWAFRNYNRQWHDRGWWRSHYTRIIFVNSGWWYWNAGYWFPAWGFAPYVSYVYDGPISGYNGLPPDQVTVNVQETLATAGYYDGPIDGVLGPMTREAIAAYQADNGLAVTSAIDEPTLATMGLV